MPVGFLNANRMPLRAHENILVFYKKLPTFHPQKWKGIPYSKTVSHAQSGLYGHHNAHASASNNGDRYPLDVIEFSNNANKGHRFHPTEKPVDLLEYLIKTYTDEGNTVLDNAMGSGSTGVAARHLGRRFIGIEMNQTYFDIALNRLTEGRAAPCSIESAPVAAGK